MTLEVKQPGLATTVQDLGRNGYYALGFPQGGALDQESALFANALVGNAGDCAVLECAYTGPVLTTTGPVCVAVTGAPVDVLVNGEHRPQWTRLKLEADDELSFGLIKGGTRFFIAVRGGIDVPVVLGSRSTYTIGGIGGINGRPLQIGDRLPLGMPTLSVPHELEVRERDRPIFAKEQEIRVMLGLYDHLLSNEGLRRLIHEDWTLTPTADRMGMRYSGPGVEWRKRRQPFGAGQDPSNIVDAGYAVGSIQIPGGTQPIVLHRDAVSGGGYAMVATVVTADLDTVARAAPGTVTRFVPIDMDTALAARRRRHQRIDKVIDELTR